MRLPADVEAALRQHATAVERLVNELSAQGEAHDKLRRQAETAVEEACAALAEAALPSLEDEDSLKAAAALLHDPAFEPASARASVEQRETYWRARKDAAANDPRFPDATARLAQVDARARELVEPIAHLRESVRTLEQDRDFSDFAAGAHDDRWWTFSYHRRRAAGARALERHGRKRRAKSASELVKKHREERSALATLEQEVSRLSAERRALGSLLEEHAHASAALAGVADAVLAELRARYLGAKRFLADEVLLTRFCEPPLRAFARRISGCRARVRYLEALFAHHIERTRGALVNHLEDVSLVLRDPTAPRRGLGESAAAIEAQTHARTRAVREQIHLYRSTAERLMAFTRWDEHDPLSGQLWWDAFTGGTLDGSFIDEVAWHRTMGRPRGPTLPHARVDARDTWARNALSAMDALAEAHAEVLAEKRAAASSSVQPPSSEEDG